MDITREKNELNKYVKKGLKEVGLSHLSNVITIHSFRRSFIHYIYKEYEKDIEFVCACARHSSGVGMTGKYLQTKTEKIKERLQEKMK